VNGCQPDQMMHCSIIGKKNQGRKPKKWIENLKQDIDMRNIQCDKAMAMTHDEVNGRSQIIPESGGMTTWHSGNAFHLINEFTLHQARLVLG